MAASSVNPTFFSQSKLVKNVKLLIPTSQALQLFTKKSHVAGARAVRAVAKEQNVIPTKSNDCTDHQSGVFVSEIKREVEGGQKGHLIGVGDDGSLSFDELIDRGINASIVLAAGTFAITKLLTIDHDYWHGCSDNQKTVTIHMPVLERAIMRVGATISVILVLIQLTSPVPLPGWDVSFIPPAEAVLYSPDTKVPRTGELALRKAIPANTNMKSIQNSLEELSYLLRIPQRKPYGTMESNVKKALKIAVDEKESILASLPADQKERGLEIYASLTDGKGGLQTLLGYIKDKDPDRVSVALASSLDSIAQLELLQAPGLSFLLPAQYTNYPRLTGRAVVELVIEKGDGSMFTSQAGGVPRKAATIRVVLDGYSAPLTAGNVAKLVVDGAYDGIKLKCTDQAILSYNGIDKNIGYRVPLEIMPSGQFEPLYKTTLSIQDGELPVLPLSVYGAVAMAHDDVSEEYSSPNQFFFYLYDKSYSGLGGLSFDEGQFSVFGYTTAGRDILPQIKTGDMVRSAKLVEGQDNLVLPAEKL